MPAGGAIIHQPDGTVEPVGRSAVELRMEDGRMIESILYAPDRSSAEE